MIYPRNERVTHTEQNIGSDQKMVVTLTPKFNLLNTKCIRGNPTHGGLPTNQIKGRQ